LKEQAAISSTSACTGGSDEPSHVLAAMGVPRPKAGCSVRLAWCHLTPEPDWEWVVATLQECKGGNCDQIVSRCCHIETLCRKGTPCFISTARPKSIIALVRPLAG